MTLNQLARQAEAAEDKAAALLAEKEAQEATMADAVQAAQQLATLETRQADLTLALAVVDESFELRRRELEHNAIGVKTYE